MPLFFVGHGSPMNALEDNEFTRGWKKAAGLDLRPRAILCVSAHWETRGVQFTAMERPRTIHDFGGFSSALHQVQYPAPGSPELAQNAGNLLNPEPVTLDSAWGLDHGSWSVLKHLFPEAQIPVVQMSLDVNKDPRAHYELARGLRNLREQGVLIIGSGNMVHNLGKVAWDKMREPEFGYDWALEARAKMNQAILERDHKTLMNFSGQGRAFDLSIPTPEHFLPLLYILGLQEEDEPVEIFNDKPVMGSLTMTSLRIG